jgi:hypothetical protein
MRDLDTNRDTNADHVLGNSLVISMLDRRSPVPTQLYHKINGLDQIGGFADLA